MKSVQTIARSLCNWMFLCKQILHTVRRWCET